MSITGGVKFFDINYALLTSGAEGASSSGSAAINYALDRNEFTKWRSVGSNDSTTETFIVTFSEEKTINRVFLIGINLKNFNVKYNVSGVWTNFSGVTDLDGDQASATRTDYDKSVAYFEFDEITTDSIQISMTETQAVDEEKKINQIVATYELGTLEGYPRVRNNEVDRNERRQEVLSGKSIVIKSLESFKVSLEFRDYPPSLGDDIDLMFSLFDREDNFMIWLCGGRYGTDYFRYTIRGFRLDDLKTVQTVGKIKTTYMDNVYNLAPSFDIDFEEVVD